MATTTLTSETRDIDRVLDQVSVCEVSRASRRAAYEQRQLIYEMGSPDGREAKYKKIRAHLDLVGSYLFAPETTRFSAYLPVESRGAWFEAGQTMSDEYKAAWSDSGADLLWTSNIEWALVYGCLLNKVQKDPITRFRFTPIQPWDFGVGREDQVELEEQDLLCHWYTMSVPQVERWAYGYPGEDRIVEAARAHATTPVNPTNRSGLVVSSVSGVSPHLSITGSFPGDSADSSDALLTAQVAEPVVELCDLWERRLFKRRGVLKKDEVYEDWLVTTLIPSASVLISQRRNPDLPWTKFGERALPAEHPFLVIRPRPRPDYFWGRSELRDLVLVQMAQEELLTKMHAAVKRQLNPSTFYSGVPDAEEAKRAMESEGGVFASPEAGARMEPLVPQVGQEAFRLYDIWREVFADMSGVPAMISQGQPPGDMRNFPMMAGISGGRIRRMALLNEDALANAGTKSFHVMQRTDDTAYPMGQGKKFLLSDLPEGTRLRVSAHSSSPIYGEKTQAVATALMDRKAIRKPAYVALLDPPGVDALVEEAKAIEANEAQMAQERIRLEEEKIKARGPGGRLPR